MYCCRYILDARELPIVTNLKKIKDQLMIRFFSKRKETEEMYGNLCPKIREKLDKNIDFTNNYSAMPAAENLFKIVCLKGEYEVRIDRHECSCRQWQLTGVPCRHACAAFRHERIKPESAVHKCYSVDAFKAAYCHVILPCSDPKVWKKMNGPTMTPPKYDKKIGRPTKKRRKSPLEEDGGTRLSRHGIIGRCGACNQPGHNKRKCPKLGRGPQPEQEAAAQPQQQAAAQPDHVPIQMVVPDDQPEFQADHVPIQIVVPDDEPEFQTQPPMKMPVKRNTSKVHCCNL